MSIQSVGFKAYSQALQNFAKAENKTKNVAIPTEQKTENSFADLLTSSLDKVNQLQSERSSQITAFASGESQNVHELMISLQKAGLAMNMTAAVRNKVMEAYKELSRMQF
jgi:flagellar hook-basal body complex protein FliE